MLYRLLVIALYVCSCQVSAFDITVYRWVDDKNIVHFSQHQPKHDNYTELTMSEAFKAAEKEEQALSVQQQLDGSVPKTKLTTENTTQTAATNEMCASARLNLKTLATFDKIQYTDPNGEVKMLTNEQKNQQQALSEKQVEVYCSKQ